MYESVMMLMFYSDFMKFHKETGLILLALTQTRKVL